MKQKPTIYLLVTNHFDLIWRRCWNQRHKFRNQQFASYADLEEYWIGDNLNLARRHKEYKFEIESTAVIRNYLRRHPGRRTEVQRLAREGRLGIAGAGDNIVDSNLVTGESLARNFLTGLLWLEENLGIRCRHGVRNDAFGNSAQIPQLFRLCGIRWVRGLDYSPPNGEYWKGLDGSTVCCGQPPLPSVGQPRWVGKYQPCPSCQGKGCSACAGRGIHIVKHLGVKAEIDEKILRKHGMGKIWVGGEEDLPPAEEFFDCVRRMSAKYDVRFAIGEDLAPLMEQKIVRVDDAPLALLHSSVELNPNNCGVYVSRIKRKQTLRRQEYALLAAETLATLATSKGAAYPRKELAAVWEKLLLTMFHDAITSTHVDAAYRELEEVAAEIDAATSRMTAAALARMGKPAPQLISVVNASGSPVSQIVSAIVPARSPGLAVRDELGKRAPVVSCEKADGQKKLRVRFVARNVGPLAAKHYRFAAASTRAPKKRRGTVIENEIYRVEADRNGIQTMVDKRSGRKICAAGKYRPNELILEEDIGGPWATTSPSRIRMPMSAQTTLRSVETHGAQQTMTFEGKVYGVVQPQCLEMKFTMRVSLCEGIERVEFATDVWWTSHNCRLRVAMPVPFRGRCLYGIPYGTLERQAYEPNFDGLSAANGNWPAINWAGVEGMPGSVALLNKGLPSYLIEPDGVSGQTMFLSLARSPAYPTYLHTPPDPVMTDYDGMRDEGDHHFEYALAAYDAPFADSPVVQDGEAYNARLTVLPGRVELPDVPRVQSDHVRLTALKLAERSNAPILRLVEFRGRTGSATVSLPVSVTRVEKVNLLEKAGKSLPITEGKVTITMKPWEIATIRLE